MKTWHYENYKKGEITLSYENDQWIAKFYQNDSLLLKTRYFDYGKTESLKLFKNEIKELQ